LLFFTLQNTGNEYILKQKRILKMKKICSKCREEKDFTNPKENYCKSCKKEYNAKWRKENREYHNARVKKWTQDRRRLVIEHYGAKCVCCGESNYAFLTLDHKNNDGNIERKLYKNQNASIMARVIKDNFPDTYQILCYNCNHAKANLGKCPHGGC